MSSFEELVRECDRLWLNCRCTRLRLTPVKKQVQKDNRRKAVELKADWETFLQHAAENLEDAGWKTEMDRRVLALLRSESVLNFAVLKPAVQEEFLSITKQFVRDAMCFDTALELDDIMHNSLGCMIGCVAANAVLAFLMRRRSGDRCPYLLQA